MNIYNVIDGQAFSTPKPNDDLPIYGTMVGCVRYGGVIATPIRIRQVELYDVKAWLDTGAMVHAGYRWEIKIEGDLPASLECSQH